MTDQEKKRIQHEIEHGKKISEEAESVWNWSSPAGQVRADRRARLLVRYGEIRKGEQVLEIGCGTGLFSGKVFDLSGADITAMDISEDLLSQAREKYPQIKFEIGDAMNLNYNDNHFDVVFGSSVLHHLNYQLSCNEIFRVLKKGGRMVFAEPNMINPQILIQKNVPYIKEKLGDSPDESAIIRWSFKKLLLETGFTEVEIIPYDFLHPITPKPLINFVNGIGKVVEKIPVLKEIAGSVIIAATK